jgi:predicted TIM-barrel fold metal-dependent hydrolase
VAAGAVGLKTIAAYRCGLDLPPPSGEAASGAYDAWRRSGSSRLRDPALVSLFLADAVEATGEQVPVQIHTGLGDADQLLAKADPALLQDHIDHGLLAGRPVVLLHCYPFVRQAGYLASIYAHVHVDLSLAVTLVPHRAPELVAEALELAPPSKLLFATDASRLPEMFLLGTHWWREALARALAPLVDDDFVDEPRARQWAEQILAGNARRLYRLREG